ncbi:MAG: prephenate dehydrogenase [Clostridia bacterium]|nr:prephenate dehydrogenase [Clostridia bacterium]
MKVGIVGLGLMGGSLAKAISFGTEHTVWGTNRSPEAVKKALFVGAIEKELTKADLPLCDLVIVSLYPQASIDYIKENATLFKKGSIVMDISGVKRYVCDALYDTAKENGFVFLGAHPMAGLHLSGFEHSTAKIFNNSSMILTPYEDTPWGYINTVKELFLKIGFTNIQMSTPDEHDKIIAFTSQLAHIVSNAYVKSPNALIHKGFSAGSYKDLTRVAYLNEDMWSELFLENRDNLINEIDSIVNNLVEYKKAMENNDREKLAELLRDGKLLKEQIDG